MIRGALAALALVIFFSACGSAEIPAPAGEPIALAPRVTWLGIYAQGAKVGWARHEIKRVAESGSPADYRLEHEDRMTIAMMGVQQNISIELSVDFTDQLEPVGYEFEVTSDGPTGIKITSTGRVEGNTLHVRTKSPEGEREREVELDDVNLFGLNDLRATIDGYRVGQVIEGELFVPELFDVVPYRTEVIGVETIRSGADLDTVFIIRSKVGNITSNSVVSANGEMIRSDGPMGIEFMREDEVSAKKMDRRNVVDLALKFGIPVEIGAVDPSKVARAVYRASGVDSPSYESSGSQSVTKESDHYRIIVDNLKPERAKLSKADLARYLAPSPNIQSDDPRVVAKSREILGDLKDPKAKADRLMEWTHRNMEQAFAFTIPSTVDVLASMKGDCGEHAALYTGLARAAGLPTRIAVGLGYVKGGMYYHAWNEVWIGDRWYPVDATFGEAPASALHLRLLTGEEPADQLDIALFAGELKLEVSGIETAR